jgi:acyl carrier protein
LTLTIIREILERDFEFDPREIHADTDFQGDLALDSVMFISLVIGIESRLGIKVPDDRFGDIATVRDLCELIDVLTQLPS